MARLAVHIAPEARSVLFIRISILTCCLGSKIFRTDGFDDDDNDDDFDDYDNLDEYDGNIDSEDARDLCSSLVPSTTTIAGAAVTRTTYSTYICQTTATPTPTTASRPDDDDDDDDDDEITTTSSIDSGAKPTGAVDTKFLMGIVGAGVGAAVLGF